MHVAEYGAAFRARLERELATIPLHQDGME